MPPTTNTAKTPTPAAALDGIENQAFLRDAAWISEELSKRQKSRFYGKLSLCMEGGLVTRLVVEESIKPPR